MLLEIKLIIGVILLALLGAAGYFIHDYSTQLAKAKADIVMYKSNEVTYRTDLATCATTNSSNLTTIDKLRSDNQVAEDALNLLAQQKVTILSNFNNLSKDIAKAKGTVSDGQLSPVLRDTLKQLHSTL